RRHTRFSRDWSSDMCSSDLCPLVNSKLLFYQREHIIALRSMQDRVAIQDVSELVRSGYSLNSRLHLFQDGSHQLLALFLHILLRSEERRVGKECRALWWLAP